MSYAVATICSPAGALAEFPHSSAAPSTVNDPSDAVCTPLKRRRGRKRTLLPVIMRAAMGLFAQRGFEQPTMDQVAKTAGIRKATLYIYFDGKSALIDAVVARWLREMPCRPTVRSLPLREQLIDIGLQLQTLAAHPATVALTKWIGEVELRLSPQQLSAWRGRYTEFKSHLAELLRLHCHCENRSLAANQFLLLALGDLALEFWALRNAEMERIEGAVELILRAYPQRAAQTS
jgi:AcrR family transcriptional regulator